MVRIYDDSTSNPPSSPYVVRVFVTAGLHSLVADTAISPPAVHLLSRLLSGPTDARVEKILRRHTLTARRQVGVLVICKNARAYGSARRRRLRAPARPSLISQGTPGAHGVQLGKEKGNLKIQVGTGARAARTGLSIPKNLAQGGLKIVEVRTIPPPRAHRHTHSAAWSRNFKSEAAACPHNTDDEPYSPPEHLRASPGRVAGGVDARKGMVGPLVLRVETKLNLGSQCQWGEEGRPRDALAYLAAAPAEVERPARGVGLIAGRRRGWSELVGWKELCILDVRCRAEESGRGEGI